MSTNYYNHGGIRVTAHDVVIHGQRYELGDLHQLRIARGSASRAAMTCAASAPLFVLLGSCSMRAVGPNVGLIVALVGVLTLTVAALAIRRTRPRPYELWAEYRGHTVMLLWSRDERVFNQIRFAILRARQSGVASR